MPVPSDNLNPITERPNYYAGQYLLEDDFELEQQYHIDRLRRHHRLLHVAGIVDGLEVSWANNSTNTKLQVTAGTAIDADGRQIVLAQNKADGDTVIPAAIATNGSILWIRYESSEWSNQSATAAEGQNRIKENPVFEWGTTLPPGAIALARVTPDKQYHLNDRVYSGIRLPSPLNTLGQGLTLRYKGNGKSPGTGQLELAEFAGNLSITGNVGIGPTTPSAKLAVVQNGTGNAAYFKGGAVTIDDVNGQNNALYITNINTEYPALWVGQNGTGNAARFKGGTVTIDGVNGQNNALYITDINTEYPALWAGQKGTGRSAYFEGGSGVEIKGDLCVEKNVGIGTQTPKSKLHIDKGRVDITASDGTGGGGNRFDGLLPSQGEAYKRSQLVLSSGYSDLVIASSNTHNYHGSTLTFATYNPDNASEYRKWVINQGNWGPRKQFLEFGYSDAGSANPHDNISDDKTVLTLDGISKRVGIGTRNPSVKLEVNTGGGTTTSLKCEHKGSNFIVRPNSDGGNSTIIENTSGGALLINPSGDNVGIGTSNPQARLHVQGGIAVTQQASNAAAEKQLESMPNCTSIIGWVTDSRLFFYWKGLDGKKYACAFTGRSGGGSDGFGTT